MLFDSSAMYNSSAAQPAEALLHTSAVQPVGSNNWYRLGFYNKLGSPASLRRLCIYHALHLGSNSSCAVIIVIMQSCSQNAPD